MQSIQAEIEANNEKERHHVTQSADEMVSIYAKAGLKGGNRQRLSPSASHHLSLYQERQGGYAHSLKGYFYKRYECAKQNALLTLFAQQHGNDGLFARFYRHPRPAILLPIWAGP
jgi:hypothetical protein